MCSNFVLISVGCCIGVEFRRTGGGLEFRRMGVA